MIQDQRRYRRRIYIAVPDTTETMVFRFMACMITVTLTPAAVTMFSDMFAVTVPFRQYATSIAIKAHGNRSLYFSSQRGNLPSLKNRNGKAR